MSQTFLHFLIFSKKQRTESKALTQYSSWIIATLVIYQQKEYNNFSW